MPDMPEPPRDLPEPFGDIISDADSTPPEPLSDIASPAPDPATPQPSDMPEPFGDILHGDSQPLGDIGSGAITTPAPPAPVTPPAAPAPAPAPVTPPVQPQPVEVAQPVGDTPVDAGFDVITAAADSAGKLTDGLAAAIKMAEKTGAGKVLLPKIAAAGGALTPAVGGVAGALGKLAGPLTAAIAALAAARNQWKADQGLRLSTGARIVRALTAAGVDAVLPALIAGGLVQLLIVGLGGMAAITTAPLWLSALIVAGLVLVATLGASAVQWLLNQYGFRDWLLRLVGGFGEMPANPFGRSLAALVAAIAATLAGALNGLFPGDVPANRPAVTAVSDVSGQAPPAPPEGGSTGQSIGDPHLRTYDGYAYDFQGAGEFVLTRSTVDNFEIQVRYEPLNQRVSVTTAVAIRLGANVFEVHRGERGALIDGRGTAPGTYAFTDGARVSIAPGATPGGLDIKLTTADGGLAEISHNARSLSIDVTLAKSRARAVEGLLGDYNGNKNDDLRPRGAVTPIDQTRLTHEPLYRVFGDTWRVAQKGSHFTYLRGESTEKFTDRAFPPDIVDLSVLDGAAREAAHRTCAEAGVLQPEALDGCVLDVALSGDAGFAADAARHQLLTNVPLTLGTSPVEGRITRRGQWVVYAFDAKRGRPLGLHLIEHKPDGGGDQCRLSLHARLFDARAQKVWDQWLGPQGCDTGLDTIEVPADGRYRMAFFIDPSGPLSEAHTGSFSFALAPIPAPNTRTAAVGQTLAGELTAMFASDRWTFHGTTGQQIALDVRSIKPQGSPGCRMDLHAKLLGPDGKQVWTEWIGNWGCVAQGPIVLPATGEYSLLIHGGRGDSQIPAYRGSYEIVLMAVPQPRVKPLTLGQKVSGDINGLFVTDRWTFAADAGTRLKFTTGTLDPHEGDGCRVDLHATLLGPDGKQVWTEWIGNWGCDKAFDLPALSASGQHTLVVSGGRGDNAIRWSFGTYEFTLGVA